jgi:hypothetical protein
VDYIQTQCRLETRVVEGMCIPVYNKIYFRIGRIREAFIHINGLIIVIDLFI